MSASPAPRPPIRDAFRREFVEFAIRVRGAALRRIQDQGRAALPLLLQRRACSTTARSLGALAALLRPGGAGLGDRLRHALRPGLQGHHAGRRRPPWRLPRSVTMCRSASTARRPRTTARAATSSARRSPGRVLIVDDVITAGTSVRESVEIIRAAGATPAGVLIALDRQETGQGRALGDPGGQPGLRHSRYRDCDPGGHPGDPSGTAGASCDIADGSRNTGGATARQASRECGKAGPSSRPARAHEDDDEESCCSCWPHWPPRHAGAAYRCVDEKGVDAHRRHAARRLRQRRRCTRSRARARCCARSIPRPRAEEVKARGGRRASARKRRRSPPSSGARTSRCSATYSAEKEFDIARDRNIEPLQGRIKSAQERIKAVDKRAKELEDEMEFYKAGKSKASKNGGRCARSPSSSPPTTSAPRRRRPRSRRASRATRRKSSRSAPSSTPTRSAGST